MGHFSMEKPPNPGSVLGGNQHTGLRKTPIPSDKYVREMGLFSHTTSGEQMLVSTMLTMLKEESAEQDRLLSLAGSSA